MKFILLHQYITLNLLELPYLIALGGKNNLGMLILIFV